MLYCQSIILNLVSYFYLFLNLTPSILLKLSCLYKLIVFIKGKQLYTLMQTWICEDLFFHLIYCLDLVLFFFHLISSAQEVLLFFCVWVRVWPQQSFRHLYMNWIFVPFSLWRPPVPIPSLLSVFHNTPVPLDWFRFSIYDQTQSEGRCCNDSHEEIAVVALWLGCSWLQCCLHRASRNIFAGWVSVLCHSWAPYLRERPATLFTDLQRLVYLNILKVFIKRTFMRLNI